MNTKRYFSSFVLASMITQVIFNNAQADVGVTSQTAPAVGPTDASIKVTEEIIPGVPTLKDLLDKNFEWGLNLDAVYERQEKLRKANTKLVAAVEASVDIINIQSLKYRKEQLEVTKREIENLSKMIKNAMIKLKDETNKKKKEIIEAGIKKTTQDLQQKQEQMIGFRNTMVLDQEIEGLEKRIMKILKPMGLTLEELKKLPSRKPS